MTGDDALTAQTERLKIVNRFGWELAQHTRLTALAAALSRLFGEAIPGLGFSLWVAREQSALVDPLCQAGDASGAPVREYPLFSGREFVGKLDVFGPGDAPELALVEDLVPWVSIALGNARSFAVLSDFRDQLSQKVALRTAEHTADLKAAMQSVHPAPEPSAPTTAKRRPAILVAEDDAAVRELLRRLLSRRYELLEASNGREALEVAQRTRPALILTDVMMPVMSGLELLAALRSQPETQDLPVIMLTARQDLDERVHGLTAGANDYVSKPFSPRELLARIDTQLRLRDVASRIAQTERIAATSLITSGFAHEVRNPLNGLINALGPLREALGERPDPALAAEMLDVVEESVGRVRHLAESLLALVRSSPARTEFDLRDTLAAAERALWWKVPSTVKVERRIAPVPKLSGDPSALTQVWVNLLDNALRAAGPTGALRISAALEGSCAVVRVEDDGPGIAPEQQARLFEPFFSTRPAGEGTGLGLAMCRRIVTAHRGSIDVQSAPGVGTCVLVRLPFEMPAARTTPEVKSSRDTAPEEQADIAELTSERARVNESV